MSILKSIEPSAKVLVNIIITFIEAGIAVWSTNGFQTDRLALGAVIGAGVSAVWNLILKPILVHQGWLKA